MILRIIQLCKERKYKNNSIPEGEERVRTRQRTYYLKKRKGEKIPNLKKELNIQIPEAESRPAYLIENETYNKTHRSETEKV